MTLFLFCFSTDKLSVVAFLLMAGHDRSHLYQVVFCPYTGGLLFRLFIFEVLHVMCLFFFHPFAFVFLMDFFQHIDEFLCEQ